MVEMILFLIKLMSGSKVPGIDQDVRAVCVRVSIAYFDTVDHKIALYELHHYGFRGVIINWFPYLTYTTQIGSFISEEKKLRLVFHKALSWVHCSFLSTLVYLNRRNAAEGKGDVVCPT